MAFDPLNLLLLAIAIVVFWRLRSVLGTRTGTERPPVEPYAPVRKNDGPGEPEAANGNVLRFPKEETAAHPPAAGQTEDVKGVLRGLRELSEARE